MSEFELKIDEANLSREMSEQSSIYFSVAEEAISAELKYNEFKLQVSELYAMVDGETRALAEADGKKITEKLVENSVLQNANYKKARNHLLKLKANMDIFKARKDAFGQRSVMLSNICAMKRTEMETIAFSETKAA